MITSGERQARITAELSSSEEPLSASMFAKRFGVSRQTIVGDVALLRARGEKIIATPRGYIYELPSKMSAIIVCKHLPVDVEEEMQRIVDNGGILKDVIVDHPLYGQLRGELQIATNTDIRMFMAHLRQQNTHLLSELTGGVHSHTIAFERPEQLEAIKKSLRAAHFLYE